jgi:Matrixin.
MTNNTIADQRAFYLPKSTKLTSGISGTKYYWIDSYVPAGFSAYISYAIATWNDGNGVYNAGINLMRQTANNAGTKLDFYREYNYIDGDSQKYARTRYFDANDNLISINDPAKTKNYTYTEITYSDLAFANCSDWNAQVLGFANGLEMKLNILAHEVGHALGLNHTTNGPLRDRVMSDFGCVNVHKPSWLELKSIDVLY